MSWTDGAARLLLAIVSAHDMHRVTEAFISCRTMPMRPDQLMSIAEQEKYAIRVFRRKQLPVKPGLSERELGAMLQAYSIGA